ncbi:MAG TPA: pyridoxal 5'-phosphate synthase glutaminase subunit PdxT [Rectinemataceae bacterium]
MAKRAAPLVGVLALQGDYEAHAARLCEAGAEAEEIRSADRIPLLDGIVLPGGESGVMLSLMERFGILEPLKERILAGLPAFGTCAGLILLAKAVEGEDKRRIGALDVLVRRNAYGTQIDSFRATISTTVLGAETVEGVFIRAPRILSVGSEVEVLARHAGDPVLVRQGSILAATFHPELVPGIPLHAWFVDSFVKKGREAGQR